MDSLSIEELVSIAYAVNKRKRKKAIAKFWVHPLNAARVIEGQFHTLYDKLRKYPDKFIEYYRMTIASFDELLLTLKPSLEKKTLCRTPISAEERLTVTLRYLATGLHFSAMASDFRMGRETIRAIVKETCEIIWTVMQPQEMATPTREQWETISEQFFQKTNFPNCVGVIDGRHIRLRNPLHSGSNFHNFKKFSSIVLLAVVDADYRFIAIDVSSYTGDSTILRESVFGNLLYNNRLDIPTRRHLPNTTENELPFVFLGDETFGLHEHILRPFPKRNLTMAKRVFNYRLSRARRYAECALGILSNKWGVFRTSILVRPDFATSVTKAACVLHNFVLTRDGYSFEDTLSHYFVVKEELNFNRASYTLSAADNRQKFAEYFMSPSGEVPWQYKSALI